MAFNKHQIEAIKKNQNILRLEYINPEQVKKEIQNLQAILRNINTDFAKKFNEIKNPIDFNKFILSYLSKMAILLKSQKLILLLLKSKILKNVLYCLLMKMEKFIK